MREFETAVDDQLLTREKIDACTDPNTLAKWFTLCMESAEEVIDLAAARREGMGEHVDKDWLRRVSDKAAYLNITKRHIERRMITLDLKPPYPPSDPRSKEIKRLLDQKAALVRALKAAGIEPPKMAMAA